MKLIATLVLAVIVTLALGQELDECKSFVGGRHQQGFYSCCGTWNNVDHEMGYKLDGCSRLDVSYPGNPWQTICYQFDYVREDWVIPYTYVGNQGDEVTPGEPFNEYHGNVEAPICNYTVESVCAYPSDADVRADGVKHVMKAGPLRVTKTEVWHFDSFVNAITFYVEFPEDCCHNLPNTYIDNFVITWGLDADPDFDNFETFNTINGNAFNDWWTESVGPHSCTTIGLGKCHPDSILGHTDWTTCPKSIWINDQNSEENDIVMNFQHKFDRINCGETHNVTFLVVWAPTAQEARQHYQEAQPMYCDDFGVSPDFNDHSDPIWPEVCQCNVPGENSNETHYCTCSPGIEVFNSPHNKRGRPKDEECGFRISSLLDQNCLTSRAMWAKKTQNTNYMCRLVKHMEYLEEQFKHFPNVIAEVRKTLRTWGQDISC